MGNTQFGQQRHYVTCALIPCVFVFIIIMSHVKYIFQEVEETISKVCIFVLWCINH